MRELAAKGTSECAYFIKLFFSLYFGWPWLLLKAAGGFIILFIAGFSFGFYCVPSFKSQAIYDCMFDERRIKYPRLKDFPILPAYFLAPFLYWWTYRVFPEKTWTITSVVLWCLLGIGAFIGILILFFWFKDTKQEKPALVREWLGSKKNKICKRMRIKLPKEPQVVEEIEDAEAIEEVEENEDKTA